MTMYLSYDKNMEDVLRKGNLAFSKDNNRWQSINHYNQTLDGTRAYNLTKDIGQTLNATLSGVAANSSELSEAVRSMQMPEASTSKAGASRATSSSTSLPALKSYGLNFLKELLDKKESIGFDPTINNQVITAQMLTFQPTRNALKDQLREHFASIGISDRNQREMPAEIQLRIATTKFSSAKKKRP